MLPKILLISLFAVTSLSCAPKITIYDKRICADVGDDGAHCNHTLVEKPEDIPKAQWDKERFGMLCADSQGFSDTETAIDQICETNLIQCDYKMRAKLKEILDRIASLKK
jgi:hypothetical protein